MLIEIPHCRECAAEGHWEEGQEDRQLESLVNNLRLQRWKVTLHLLRLSSSNLNCNSQLNNLILEQQTIATLRTMVVIKLRCYAWAKLLLYPSNATRKWFYSLWPLFVNSRFQEFYWELYNSKAKSNFSNKHSFLSDYSLKKLEVEECETLGCDISIEETAEAISSLISGKRPGPDELSADIHKVHMDIVCEHLVNMLSDIHRWQLCSALNVWTRSLSLIWQEAGSQ